MASNKVWVLKYVVGNPAMFSKVRSQPPTTKAEALEWYENIDGRWRKWVEHKDDPSRVLVMNEVEKQWRAGHG